MVCVTARASPSPSSSRSVITPTSVSASTPPAPHPHRPAPVPQTTQSPTQDPPQSLQSSHTGPHPISSLALTLPMPSSFPFPYDPPYPIQTALMRHVYAAIEAREVKVAVVESPTGTGKTLSLLSSTLAWLADDKERRIRGELDGLTEEMEGGGDPPWVLAQSLERHRRTLAAAEDELEARLRDVRRKEDAKRGEGRIRKKQKTSHQPDLAENAENSDDDSFLPDDSATPDLNGDSAYTGDDDDGISPALRTLMKKLADSRTKDSTREDGEVACTKIYYASRTHSQLAQVRNELLKSPDPTPHTRTLPLASRANLCINDALRARSATASELDEGCREMISGEKRNRCPYLPPPTEDAKMLDMRDRILSTPKDIEDLVTIGRELNTCPYFGSRRAIPQAQLVTLPYNLLLQKTAREALGIDLQDNVVVIDEAHNLPDTLLSAHTPTLTPPTLHAALTQLRIYLARFRTRLAPRHGLHLRRLVRFLGAMEGFVEGWAKEGEGGGGSASASVTAVSGGGGGNGGSTSAASPVGPGAKSGRGRGTETATAMQKGKEKDAKMGPRQEIMPANSLMARLGAQVDGVNLLEIEAYLRRSKIARKISGYSDKLAQKAAEKGTSDPHATSARRRMTPPLHAVENFILALTNDDADGRLSLTQVGDKGSESAVLKYQLLNPSHHFKEIVDVARCVILAGGTMSPMGDFQVQLFPFLKERELSIFTCGHVIPPQNLQTLVIGKGPRGGELVFKYDQRGNQDMIAELGQVLTNLVNLVPHGLVVFFPSYAFLNAIKAAFQKSGLLEKINLKKKVFFEPESTSDVENVLRQYALAISSVPSASTRKGGALLLAVIGAKLSEGINFSDTLARAVVVVGLPFPSLASIELRERMRYVTELEQKLKIPRLPGAKDAGAELYENLCMKSVNQSIGRAIRHQNDYASLILVDSRYASPRISAKLPKWIGENLIVTKNFGHAVKEVGQFFREKTG
ncbi:helicase C-terminal domain-containing protein [Gautieria morchelliformis]|nr:helicase C-terminal domain-containing protein [Gautieria morchelliformis]